MKKEPIKKLESEKDKVRLKKKAYVLALKKTFGNKSKACEMAGIKSRQTYYEWYEKDPVFRKEVDSIEPDELLVDHAENALVKRIDEGDTTAIIFTLKTKGKRRGYIERQEIDASGTWADAVKNLTQE